jgi:CHASE3 domain sensor protein
MPRTWSFGSKISAALLSVALFAVAIGGVGIYALGLVKEVNEEVVSVYAARMLDVAAMRVARERRAKHVRSYLLSRDAKHLEQMRAAQGELLQRIEAMGKLPLSTSERDRLDRIAGSNALVQQAWDEEVEMRERGTSIEAILPHFERSGEVVRELDDRMNAMFDHEASQLAMKQGEAARASSRSMWLLGVAGLLAGGAALGLAWLLARGLRARVGPAIERLSTSATELQNDAEGQAASSKELAATTAEIATTMRELSAMSRQISESAKRTAQAAEEAGGSARSGDETVMRAGLAIAHIKGQVERIVGHMLDLGRRSQQIGGILELINDLAEQTNILAINATIEAAGAGDAGKRFSLVAMEIRRLADRVGGAAREIRGLVERINEAAATTVQATESGSDAAMEGASQFGDVLAAFERIAESVSVASSVAREIELGIGQQVRAVEQVSSALVEVAFVASESEKSARTTLGTAARLAEVSGQLAALITSEVMA